MSVNISVPKLDLEEPRAEAGLSQIPEEEDDDDVASQFTETTAPILTTSQYSRFVRSLIKLLVGETTLNEWIRKGEQLHSLLHIQCHSSEVSIADRILKEA